MSKITNFILTENLGQKIIPVNIILNVQSKILVTNMKYYNAEKVKKDKTISAYRIIKGIMPIWYDALGRNRSGLKGN